MDVDCEPLNAYGLPASTYPYASTFIKEIDLPQSQLAGLNRIMNNTCRRQRWQARIANAGDDATEWKDLSPDVLFYLATTLSTTDLHMSIIAIPTAEKAEEVVQGFNNDELEEWEDGLKKCVQSGNWESLVKHPKIWDQSRPQQRIPLVMETPEQQAERLHKMFHQAYRGGAVKDFVEALPIYNQIYDPKVYFGRCISILQSSGTGKSRLVEELGKEVPTLSICFRESESPRAGWPPGDQPACNFFSQRIEYKGEELAAAFLGALMCVVAKRLKARAASSRSPKDWMEDWQLDTPTNIFNSSRHKCFTEVETMANQLLKREHSDISNMRIPSPKLGDDEVVYTAADWHGSLFRMLCLPYAEELSMVIGELQTRYFILAFDECSQLGLHKRPPGTEPSWHAQWGMSLIALQRIIKAGDRFDRCGVTFWFLLLDTSSSVFDLFPFGPNTPSFRLTKGLMPLPPWVYLGFNQMAGVDHCAKIKQPADVLYVKHLKVYGRPYWSTLSNSEVLSAAYEKLFFNVTFDPRNQDHVFAALAVRIGLEIGEGEASAWLATEAVRSHMRVLVGVTGGLVVTASPSEPMLAIAAAEALNTSSETYKTAIETLLDKLILRGLVLDRGLQGEVYSRLLLMLARDKATMTLGPSFVKYDAIGSEHNIQAVRLSCFLQTLLGDDLGIPDGLVNQKALRMTLLRDTSEVWINFTHFVQLSQPIDEVTQHMLLKAWSSGFAFQCTFYQPVIDGFIVAYSGTLDGPFDASNLFVIPWQTKARSDAAGLAVARQLTAPFLIRSDVNGKPERYKPQHIVFLMDLTASSAFGKVNGHTNLTLGEAERPTGKGGRWDGYASGDEVEPVRYCLNIRGHSPREYPVLQGFEKQFNQLFQRSLPCARPEFLQFAKAMEDAMGAV